MIATFLALQAVVPIPVPPALTLQSETNSAYHLACTVADRTWKRYAVTLLQNGGRAYVAPKDDQPAAIFKTEVLSQVLGDETGKLAGLTRYEQLLDKPGYGYGTKQVELGGSDARRALIKLSEVSAEEFAISIVWTQGSKREPFAGFCRVTISRQVPLSEAETEDIISR